MEYTFVPYDSQDIRQGKNPPKNWWEEAETELKELIYSCDFIAASFAMWPTEGLTVADGHRGPVVRFPDGTYTWYYRIIGGYRKNREV